MGTVPHSSQVVTRLGTRAYLNLSPQWLSFSLPPNLHLTQLKRLAALPLTDHSAGAGANALNRVSFPGAGWRGISSASPSEVIAMQDASPNTAPGEVSQR